MNYKELWQKAYSLMNQYFSDKLDLGNHSYTGHLKRVSNAIEAEKKVNTYDESSSLAQFYNKCIIVGMLHDILEDTTCTIEELKEAGFDEEIINAIVAITRRNDEQYYFDFIERVKMNDIARIVKIHDLEDNMDIKRLGELKDRDLQRLKKYWYCWKYLQGYFNSVTVNNTIHPDRKWR